MSGKRVVNMFAFIGLVLVAFALLLTKLLGVFGISATVTGAIRSVGECIAYIVTMIYAWFYVRGKRSPWWYVVYSVALIAVILLFILNF